ncbi:hypothetical protein JYU14_01330 [Simkania negevensis]|uniref:Hydrolase n=1 Tax=Simkania negevensis TaxID=83561 RepID=A0ABS3APT0_9BACT|nr:hypothetical protein [Simkania negevensis]
MQQEIIAIVFDFDDTLSPDSTSAFLASLGIDVPAFWEDVNTLYQSHWDPIPAYLYKMIEISKRQPKGEAITQEKLQEWGKKLTFYPGVSEIFIHLQQVAKEASPTVNLEFYVISSGLEEVIRHTTIASSFTDIWGCDFAYDNNGSISFPKRIVSFTDKTRYLFHIAKGLTGMKTRTNPFAVNKKFEDDEKRIPMDQIIFVGDGYTDIPCFSLVKKAGGIPLAVCDRDDRNKWGKAWGFMEQQRITHWAVADFQEGSTLRVSLSMAVKKIAHTIATQRRSYSG